MGRANVMDTQGIVYVLCFSKPVKHAWHYAGWCLTESLDRRIHEHLTGHGSALVAAAVAAGATVELGRVIGGPLGTKRTEAWLKRQGHLRRHCGLCIERLGLRPLNITPKRHRSRAGAKAQAAAKAAKLRKVNRRKAQEEFRKLIELDPASAGSTTAGAS